MVRGKPVAAAEPSRNRAVHSIILLVLVCLAVAGLGYYLYTKWRTRTNSSSPSTPTTIGPSFKPTGDTDTAADWTAISAAIIGSLALFVLILYGFYSFKRTRVPWRKTQTDFENSR